MPPEKAAEDRRPAAPAARRRDLAGKVVIVTGAAQGIGAEFARRLASEGCQLVVADRQGDKVAAVAEAVAADRKVLPVTVDVTDEASVSNMIDATVERYGQLDGIVNNAGIYFGLKPVDSAEMSRERWDRTMSVNVWGTHLCSATAARVMKDQGRGRIVNVSSTTALFGPPRLADYVASKGAVISLSRSLAREYGPFGITVNVIAPGGTWTEATEELLGLSGQPAPDPSVVRARQIQDQAIPRQQFPEDLSGTLCFLLSDDSEMITGQLFAVDGGHVFA